MRWNEEQVSSSLCFFGCEARSYLVSAFESTKPNQPSQWKGRQSTYRCSTCWPFLNRQYTAILWHCFPRCLLAVNWVSADNFQPPLGCTLRAATSLLCGQTCFSFIMVHHFIVTSFIMGGLFFSICTWWSIMLFPFSHCATLEFRMGVAGAASESVQRLDATAQWALHDGWDVW